MREKKPHIVLSFNTTTQAMAAEKYLKENRLPGRLIPVPREITAGCGLAWKAPLEDKNLVLNAMTEAGLVWEAATELMLV